MNGVRAMTDILDPSGLFLFAQPGPAPNDDGTGVIIIVVIMGVYFVTAGDDDGHSPNPIWIYFMRQ